MKGGLTSVAIFGKFTFVGWFLSKLLFKSKTHKAQQNTRAESPGQQYTHKCLDASYYVFQMTFYANSWFEVVHTTPNFHLLSFLQKSSHSCTLIDVYRAH